MARNVPRLPTSRVGRRIALRVRAEPRRLWTPKALAVELGLSQGTVRKELWRLSEPREDDTPPPVFRVAHGLYRAFTDPGALRNVETPEPVTHAIQLGCALPQNRGWGPPAAGTRAWGSLGQRPEWVKDPANGQWLRDETWAGRLVTVAVSPGTGGVQVSVKASRDPLKLREWDPFDSWLRGWLQGQGIVWSDPEVQNLEMNEDYKRVCMANVRQRLNAGTFRNAWAQVYQKNRETLRAEIRLHKVEDEVLTFREAVSLLELLATKREAQEARDVEPAYVPPPVDPDAPEVA